METLKGVVDFLCTYPTWARISIGYLLLCDDEFHRLAPVFRTPASRSTAVMLEADRRLAVRLAAQSGFERHTYPVLGLGLLTPAAWSVEDAAAKFAGGEVDLVKRYEDTKAIVGVKLRITAARWRGGAGPDREANGLLSMSNDLPSRMEQKLIPINYIHTTTGSTKSLNSGALIGKSFPGCLLQVDGLPIATRWQRTLHVSSEWGLGGRLQGNRPDPVGQ